MYNMTRQNIIEEESMNMNHKRALLCVKPVYDTRFS